jgi:hypothetical protein
MTVTSTTPSVQFTANGSTTEFAFTFVAPASDSGGSITTSSGAIDSGDQTLTVSTSDFFYTSDLVGKAITVTGAGAASATLSTTILSRTSGTVVELTDAASTTVTGQTVVVTTGTYATTLNNNSDIKVYVDGVLKTYTTHYTVRLAVGDDSNKPGTVIFGSAPAEDSIVTIQRDVTLARTTDFQTGGALTAKTLNSEFDTMIMAIQDTQFDTTAGAVKFPQDETPDSSYLPASATRASKILGFDSDGEIDMRNDVTTGTSAITGTIVKGTTSLQTPKIEYTDGDDAIVIGDGGTVEISQSLTAGSVDINGGAIDGTPIGANSHSTGKFTTLTSTGATVLQGLTYPSSDGSAGYVLKTDGSGNLSFSTVAGLSLFTALTDTPANYTSSGSKFVRVNSGASALEFTDTVITEANTKTLTNKTLTSPVINTGISGTALLDSDTMSGVSATTVSSSESIKAYVDSQVASEDTLAEMNDVNLTSPADGSLLLYDTATSKWIDNVMSGDATLADTGAITIAANAVEGSMLNTDVVSAQTELASGLASTDELMVSDAGTLKKMDVSVLTGYNASLSETLTNKTIDVDNNTVSNIELDNLKSGVLDTDISSVSGSDDTIASAKAIKTYVDAKVTAEDLDVTSDSGTIDIDLDSETLTVAGGTGITTSATGTTVTVAGSDASTSAKGIASFDSNYFGVSSGAVTIGTDTIDNTNIDWGSTGNQVDTDDMPEGSTNLYYTDTRARAVSIENVVEDTSPQLGGALDVNGNDIVSTSNGHIDITPHGTGNIRMDTDLVEQFSGNGIIITHKSQGEYNSEQWSSNGMLFNTGIQIEGRGQYEYPAIVLLNNSDTGYPNLWAAKARPGSGPDYDDDDYLEEGDIIFRFFGAPYQGTWSGNSKFTRGAATVDLYASEDHSDGNYGGGFRVKTLNKGTDVGATAETEKIRIEDFVWINSGNLDVDFRVDGDSVDNLLFVNANTDRVGIKTDAPDTDFHVAGTFKATTLDSSIVLSKLGDVHTATPGDGEFLKWVDSNSRWEPAAIGISATLAANLDTAGYKVGQFDSGINTDDSFPADGSGNYAYNLRFAGGTQTSSGDDLFTGATTFEESGYYEFGLESWENWETGHSEGTDSIYKYGERNMSAITLGLPFDQTEQGDRYGSTNILRRARPTLKFQNRGKVGASAISATYNSVTEEIRAADSLTVGDFQFGGVITTEHADSTDQVSQQSARGVAGVSKDSQSVTVPNCNDLIIGAFPVGDAFASFNTMDTAVVGDVVIQVGGKSDDLVTGPGSFGSLRDPITNAHAASQKRNYYNIEEAVRFESPSTGSLASQTFTINSSQSLVAGNYLVQATTGATARVKTTTSSSTSVVVVNVDGSWNTTNSVSVTDNGGVTSSAVFTPTNLGSSSGGISEGGARATFGVPIVFPNLTDTQRDALTAAEGMVIYNATDNKLQVYNGSAWETITSST